MRMVRIEHKKERNKWIPFLVEEKRVEKTFFENYKNASGFFRAAGGFERLDRTFWEGLPAWRVTSISPDRRRKIVAIFIEEYTEAEK